MKTVTSNGAIVLDAAYTGATATGAYVITSDGTFPPEFDPYLIYAASVFETGRSREMSPFTQQFTQDRDKTLAGLMANEMMIPDHMDGQRDFAREPILLGDDYAKFPFIQGNP